MNATELLIFIAGVVAFIFLGVVVWLTERPPR